MSIPRTVTLLLVLTWLALAFGCGGNSAPTIPDTPDGTVKAVSEGMANNQPQVLWAAAPPSYQKDVNDLAHLFAGKMDAEVWNRTMGTARKTVSLLHTRKDMILKSKMLEGMGMADMTKVEAEWNNVVGVIETVLDSDLSSLDKIKKMDVGDFLADTGAKLMRQVEAAAAAAKDDVFQKEVKAQFRDVKVKVLSQEGDKATIEVSAAGKPAKKSTWTKVENRWVPDEIASEWAKEMASARKQIEAMDTQFSEKDKQKFFGMLTMVDQTLDKLAAAKNQGEFDATLGELMGGMMGGMMGGGRPGSGQKPGGFQVPK